MARTPVILPSQEHTVTEDTFSRSALKVLRKLNESGHAAYLVGGGVRDALVGIKPKDFDIATDASPETVRKLFRNSRIIGRRFKLVHVVYGREIIEVATFRAAHDKGAGGEVIESGRIVRDNVYGTIEEDACRRDFSVNALYYNIADGSVVDFVGGLKDMNARVFRLIGNPAVRCAEDPVRVLRAVRLSAKLEFDIEPATLQAMRGSSAELGGTPPARLFEEVLKLFQGGYALRSFAAVREHNLLQYLFPLLDKRLQSGNEQLQSMLDAALENTDKRVATGKPITPAYLLAFMMWPDVEERALRDTQAGVAVNDALHDAADTVLKTQLRVISIPKRFSGPMREIWLMQPRLERNRGARALALMEDRRFRAAYDFLCLRASIDPQLKPVAAWWTKVQNLSEEDRPASADNRPVADGIWGDAPIDDNSGRRRSAKPGGQKTGRNTRRNSGRNSSRNSGKSSAEQSADSTAENSTADPTNSDVSSTADGATDAPKKKRRRRRRRKPGGDKGSAATSQGDGKP